MRTYVLDTSVLLSDPHAPLRFDEHAVVLPVTVVTELEGKRHDAELGYFARTALRLLDGLRAQHGRLDLPVPVGDQGGTLRVELNGVDDRVLPTGMRLGDNDTRILSVAASLAKAGQDVVVVSKDLPMRIKASSLGLAADQYRAELASQEVYTGMGEAALSEEEMSRLWDEEPVPVAGLIDRETAEDLADQPVHTGVIATSSRGSALATVVGGALRLVRPDREVFGVRGRSAEQRIAIDHLINPEIGIVSLGGRAGTGKSALALAAGLDAVVNRREHRKVIVFRPLYAVGGQNLGFLPGDTEEKMTPWAEAVFDTLSSVVPAERVQRVTSLGQLEVLPLTHVRGRSLHDAFVIVDEAQSLERNVLLTVLSRIGQGSKVVLTHDVAQRDNLRVGRWDGVASVVESLKGKDLFAHIDLVRTERSPIAELVTRMLDDVPRY
ncbi:PhoH family protein [Actinomyces israelii]|uniref:PhoH family protein n=1 Tax=Actinomyces israelii TaxID=1659 RepID=UPI0023520485|nr:PhoH family protein [Actinomyces israelii]